MHVVVYLYLRETNLRIMKKLFIVAITVSLLAGCQGGNNNSNGSMTVTLNGSAWSATSFNNTILHITSGTPTGKRLDLRGTANGLQIILSMAITSSSTGYDMPITTYSTGSSTYEALITIMSGFNTEAMSTGTAGDNGTITLTSLNASDKKCSGTFQFDAMDLNTDSIIYTGVNGHFTDMYYDDY